MKADAVRKRLLEVADRTQTPITARDLLSSSSTMLNLACSGRVSGAYAKGTYNLYVGDSESGKTFMVLSCLAEACRNRNFDDYRLIYDSVEDGALMDWELYFGPTAAKRIEPPAMKEGEPAYTETVEDFYYTLDDAFALGTPFVYVLDSMDALVPKAELKKFRKQKNASRTNQKEAGDYGMAKARLNSQYLRLVIPKLKKSGSILIIISQTRDKADAFSFEKSTRSGGRALRFYATLEMWSSVRESLSRTVAGKMRQYGVMTQIKVKKNRLQGKKRTVMVPIIHDYGVDDVGSCVDYLVDEGRWKAAGESVVKIKAPEFSTDKLTRSKLIKLIEDDNGERQLRRLVADTWNTIEAGLKPDRKQRYK